MFTRRSIIQLLAVAIPQIVQPTQIKAMVPQRRRVVPMEFIQKFHLRPAQSTYGEFVLGEDGLPYDFDDIMAAMFEMTAEHWKVKK